MTLRIVVCVKAVPKPEEVTFNTETKTLDRTKAENVLNPPDKDALEAALALRDAEGGTVSVVSMGPPLARDLLDLCIGMGADRALLASDRLFAGSDTFPTSLVLARAVEKTGRFDLVLCGEESADAATGQVPSGIAEWLHIPAMTFVEGLRYDNGWVIARRSLGAGHEFLTAPPPLLLSVAPGTRVPRFPWYSRVDASAKNKTVEVVTAADLGLKEPEIGLKGSFTIVDRLVEGESTTRRREFVKGDPRAQAARLAQILAPVRED